MHEKAASQHASLRLGRILNMKRGRTKFDFAGFPDTLGNQITVRDRRRLRRIRSTQSGIRSEELRAEIWHRSLPLARRESILSRGGLSAGLRNTTENILGAR